jgi:hypothetical protein
MSLAAPPEAVYPDIDTGFAAIQAHAKAHGYALVQRDKKATRVLYTCDRAGKYDSKGKNPNVHISRQRKNTGSKKCECLMRVVLRLDQISSTWSLKVLETTHNHGPSIAVTAHPAHRIAALAPDTRVLISTLSCSGLLPAQILTTLRDSDLDISLIPKDIANLTQKHKLDELNRKTPIQWLIEVGCLIF